MELPKPFSTRKMTLEPTQSKLWMTPEPWTNSYTSDPQTTHTPTTILLSSGIKRSARTSRGPMFQRNKFLSRSKGGQTNFVIEPSFGVEATERYPDVRYTTVDEYLNQFV